MAKPVFRFAPSPNGFLHAGHALSALLNYETARALGGDFLLRIEDIDRARSRVEFEDAILEDLAWLGVTWKRPVRRQSQHLSDYAAALERLNAMGLVYPSFESRAEIAQDVAARDARAPWPRDPDGVPLYPGGGRALAPAERERRMAAGDPFALRLDLQRALERTGALHWQDAGSGPDGETGRVAAQPQAWGDVVLARKDTPTSYHLSVVVDDALQGVTHVVRGQDLFFATSVHRLLQTLLGLAPPAYQHHRLIYDAKGRKLAKSTGATPLRQLRREGATPSDIRRLVGLE